MTKIYCKGCSSELWWEEDETPDGTICYVCTCSECNENHLALHKIVSQNKQALEDACIALSANVLAGDTKHRKITLHALCALQNIEKALDDCGE